MWTTEETNVIKSIYPNGSKEEILEALPNRTWHQIQLKANKMEIYRRNDYYSKEDEEFILANYLTMKSGKLSKILGRSSRTIERKAKLLGLSKQEKWSKTEINILKSFYRNLTIEEIHREKIKNRTVSSIYSKAKSIGLMNTKPRYTNISNTKLLDILLNFYIKYGRTPTKDELGRYSLPSYHIYVKRFGNYSNACKLSGIPINTGIFNFKIQYSKNGDLCWSNMEKAITDFFIDNNIYFEKEIRYSSFCPKGDTGYSRCDWILEDGTVVEYFGMMKIDKYKEVYKKKVNLCKINKVNLIELFEKDVHNLYNIFYAYIR